MFNLELMVIEDKFPRFTELAGKLDLEEECDNNVRNTRMKLATSGQAYYLYLTFQSKFGSSSKILSTEIIFIEISELSENWNHLSILICTMLHFRLMSNEYKRTRAIVYYFFLQMKKGINAKLC